MIWIALAVCAYGFFELFQADHALRVSLALNRIALGITAIVALRFASGVILIGAVLFAVVAMLGSLVILRKEVQLRNDQR